MWKKMAEKIRLVQEDIQERVVEFHKETAPSSQNLNNGSDMEEGERVLKVESIPEESDRECKKETEVDLKADLVAEERKGEQKAEMELSDAVEARDGEENKQDELIVFPTEKELDLAVDTVSEGALLQSMSPTDTYTSCAHSVNMPQINLNVNEADGDIHGEWRVGAEALQGEEMGLEVREEVLDTGFVSVGEDDAAGNRTFTEKMVVGNELKEEGTEIQNVQVNEEQTKKEKMETGIDEFGKNASNVTGTDEGFIMENMNKRKEQGEEVSSEPRYKCVKCEYIGEKEKAQWHVITNHAPLEKAPYHCTLCQFRMGTEGQADQHLRSTRHRKKKRGQEDKGQGFIIKGTEVYAVKLEGEDKDLELIEEMYKCIRCDYVGKKSKAEWHVILNHAPLEKAPYHCSLCQFRMGSEQQSIQHLKSSLHKKKRKGREDKGRDFIMEAIDVYVVQWEGIEKDLELVEEEGALLQSMSPTDTYTSYAHSVNMPQIKLNVNEADGDMHGEWRVEAEVLQGEEMGLEVKEEVLDTGFVSVGEDNAAGNRTVMEKMVVGNELKEEGTEIQNVQVNGAAQGERTKKEKMETGIDEFGRNTSNVTRAVEGFIIENMNKRMEQGEEASSEPRYKCVKCDYIAEKEKAQWHVITNHAPLEKAPYHCTLCQFRMGTERQTNQHLKSTRHRKKKKGQEDKGQGFIIKGTEVYAVKLEGEDKDLELVEEMYKCIRCDYVGKKSKAEWHVILNHAPLEKAPFHCSLCQFRMGSEQQSIQHLKSSLHKKKRKGREDKGQEDFIVEATEVYIVQWEGSEKDLELHVVEEEGFTGEPISETFGGQTLSKDRSPGRRESTRKRERWKSGRGSSSDSFGSPARKRWQSPSPLRRNYSPAYDIFNDDEWGACTGKSWSHDSYYNTQRHDSDTLKWRHDSVSPDHGNYSPRRNSHRLRYEWDSRHSDLPHRSLSPQLHVGSYGHELPSPLRRSPSWSPERGHPFSHQPPPRRESFSPVSDRFGHRLPPQRTSPPPEMFFGHRGKRDYSPSSISPPRRSGSPQDSRIFFHRRHSPGSRSPRQWASPPPDSRMLFEHNRQRHSHSPDSRSPLGWASPPPDSRILFEHNRQRHSHSPDARSPLRWASAPSDSGVFFENMHHYSQSTGRFLHHTVPHRRESLSPLPRRGHSPDSRRVELGLYDYKVKGLRDRKSPERSFEHRSRPRRSCSPDSRHSFGHRSPHGGIERICFEV